MRIFVEPRSRDTLFLRFLPGLPNTDSPDANKTTSSVAPLNIGPSRARRTLQRRLAERQEREGDGDGDDDQPEIDLDHATPEDERGESGLQITGLRTVSGAGSHARLGRFGGLFVGGSSDEEEESHSDDSDDEGHAGRDETLFREGGDYEGAGGRRRRPSTTEAKERLPLSDDEGEEVSDEALAREMQRRLSVGVGEGEGGEGLLGGDDEEEEDSSDDEGLVEIRTRRTS
ncbi:hypothetical protein PRZ48_005660 [Zasmidium cellare]|uniref:Uncharacterized protein n=1 Tax=Zasmidium cellare TaxID=395010 RepID=A0ABR0EL57_ZASCE|nr:hypothetical protein PRZ48_005660 [Zasmidium cellare]